MTATDVDPDAAIRVTADPTRERIADASGGVTAPTGERYEPTGGLPATGSRASGSSRSRGTIPIAKGR